MALDMAHATSSICSSASQDFPRFNPIAIGGAARRAPEPYLLNPELETPDPDPETPDPKPQTLKLKPKQIKPKQNKQAKKRQTFATEQTNQIKMNGARWSCEQGS
jgi:hypothetical protein